LAKHLPSGRGIREATFKEIGTGPLHNFHEKGWSEPNWVGKIVAILNEDSPKVNKVLSEYPSDYDTKSIEEADRASVMTS